MSLKINTVVFFTLIIIPEIYGDLRTIKYCCDLGTSHGESGQPCLNYTRPFPKVEQKDQLKCWKSADVCCKNKYRENQCSLGQDDAMNRKECTSSNYNPLSDDFRKECCGACQLGIESGISGEPCSIVPGLGAPYDDVFISCCESKDLVKSTTPVTTPSTTPTITAARSTKPTTNAAAYNKPNTIPDNEDYPPIENICDFSDVCGQICIPMPDSYRCDCHEGYTLMSDGKGCKANQKPPLVGASKQNCDCDHECRVTGAGIECSCHPGFELDKDKVTCNDIDECSLGRHNCLETDVCVNQKGTYDCVVDEQLPETCSDGYVFNSDKGDCDDIDECQHSIFCQSHQTCVNTLGSYECRDDPVKCPPGFYFKDSIQDCQDIDECIHGKHDCNTVSQMCLNTKGNYTCIDKTAQGVCPAGFKRNSVTSRCEDINECEENKELCGPNEFCVNESPGYTCMSTMNNINNPSRVNTYEYPDNIYTTPVGKIPITTSTTEKSTDATTPTTYVQASAVNTNIRPYEPHREHPQTRSREPESQYPQLSSKKPEPHYPQPSSKEPKSQYPHSTSRESEPQYPQPSPRTPTRQYPQPPLRESTQKSLPTREPTRQPSPVSTKLVVPHSSPSNEVETPSPSRDTENQRPHNTIREHERQPYIPPYGLSYSPKPTPISCSTGFRYLEERRICLDINECNEADDICDSTQDCVNTHGSYRCECKRGFSKDITGACVDINECQIGTHDCTEGQRCDNTIGSYYCPRTAGCGTGYTLNHANNLCEDDDECILGTHNCKSLGTQYQCKNILGSYRCEKIPRHFYVSSTPFVFPTSTYSRSEKPYPSYALISQQKKCLPGYIMNSKGDCEDVDECKNNPCARSEKCLNLNGRYQCISRLQCKIGFELNQAGTECVDIDECARGTHHCSSSQICKNANGFHVCTCPPGHKLNINNHCEDINECEYFRGRACSSNAECINTIGSFECKCHEGLRQTGRDMCDDIDECSEIPGLCQQKCVNLWGNYRCSCDRGYSLNSDNRTCSDIDECEKFKDQHLCIGTCQNTPGSYVCSCPRGYKLGSDGRTCQDIDECLENVCGRADITCLNTRGSYKCFPIDCPPNYVRDPDHKSRCKRAKHACDQRDHRCLEMPQQYSFHFMTFISKLPILQGHIDFFQMRGPVWPGSSAEFNMKIVNVNCPHGVERVNEHYFRMNTLKHKAILALVRSIEGPQEIELQLELKLYYNNIFNSKMVAKIFLIVSQYPF